MRPRPTHRWKHAVPAAAFAALVALAACAQPEPPPETPLAGGCPPFATDPADPHANDPAPTLGCVNRMNLIEMLDRPSDLVRGRELGPADGSREALGISRYEEGKLKEFGPVKPPAELVFPSGTTDSQ